MPQDSLHPMHSKLATITIGEDGKLSVYQDTALQNSSLDGVAVSLIRVYLKPGEPRWHPLVTFIMLVSATRTNGIFYCA
jgi:hypothetical protein